MKPEWTRREQVTLHQLRVDRCPLLRATLLRWKRPGEDGLCEACGELEDAEHFLCHCIKYQSARTQVLGPLPDLSVVHEEPDAVVRFIRRVGLLTEA